MWKTSISLLLLVATLISANAPEVNRPEDSTADGLKNSAKLKKYHKLDIFGESFQPSIEFARILSENYKKQSQSGAGEELFIQPIKASEFQPHRRKFDSGFGILAQEPSSTVIQLISANDSNSSIIQNRTNEEPGGLASNDVDRAKGPRFHYGEASSQPHTQTHAHEHATHSGLFFPENINEVKSPHFGHSLVYNHENYYDQHQQPQYYSQHSPKHVHGHLPVVHSTGVHHYHESGLAEAVSKSLRFWIPTALFLTGASVLFPTRIKVPTNLDDIPSRPKRSTHYEFTAGSSDEGERFEKILPAVLRREHRNKSTADEGLYDIEQVATQYYQPHESQRLAPTETSNPPTVTASRPLRRRPVQEFSKSTNATPGRAAVVKQRQNVPAHERPGSSSDYQYDAFRYQKEDPQIGEIGSSENIASPVQAPAQMNPMVSTASMTKESSVVVEKPKQGRKVRVLLRSRKNGTSVTPTPMGPEAGFVSASKLNAYNKIPRKIKVQSTKETAAGVRAVGTIAISPTKPPISSSLPLALKPSPLTNSTNTSNTFQTQLSQREPNILQLLSESIHIPSVTKLSPSPFEINSNSNPEKLYDLSPEGPGLGLLSSVIQRKDESEACQKRALCELAIRGTSSNATKFETFMWTLATLVPDAFTTFYDLEDTFAAIRDKQCSRYECDRPNLDIQE